eukprot:15833-Amphidinium_carterae.1
MPYSFFECSFKASFGSQEGNSALCVVKCLGLDTRFISLDVCLIPLLVEVWENERHFQKRKSEKAARR